jgi:hypothetical protein
MRDYPTLHLVLSLNQSNPKPLMNMHSSSFVVSPCKTQQRREFFIELALLPTGTGFHRTEAQVVRLRHPVLLSLKYNMNYVKSEHNMFSIVMYNIWHNMFSIVMYNIWHNMFSIAMYNIWHNMFSIAMYNIWHDMFSIVMYKIWG